MIAFDGIRVGEVLRFRAPSVGKAKFHLCVLADDATSIRTFVWINTYRRSYEDQYVTDCTRLPKSMPRSETGASCVSFAQPLPLTRERFKLLVPHRSYGLISPELASELATFCSDVAVRQREPRRAAYAAALRGLAARSADVGAEGADRPARRSPDASDALGPCPASVLQRS